jgi:hypothetical protein
MRSGKYYQAIKVDGKKIDLHRFLGEQIIGRPLEDDEVVHHVDGNIQNNTPENLQVMLRKDHSKMHNVGKSMSEKSKAILSAINMDKPNYSGRKLTDEEARAVFKLRNFGMTFRAIGKELGISHHCVMDIYYGKYYKNINPNLNKIQ